MPNRVGVTWAPTERAARGASTTGVQESRPGNKTIFTVVDENKIPRIVQGIEQICGTLDEPGAGILVTIPVGTVKGVS